MNRSAVKEALRLIWLEAWKRLGDDPFNPVVQEMEIIAYRAYQKIC